PNSLLTTGLIRHSSWLQWLLLYLHASTLRVIGGSVTMEQGGTAILTCHVIDTNDDLTQITWQRKTREKPRNDNFLTILPRDGVQFLSNVALKDEGSYTCIFTMFPTGNQKTEIPLNLLVPPFTNIKDNLPTLGTAEVLFATCTAAGSKPPAEVRWLTGALGDKVRTTTNSTQYDNGTTTTVSSLFGVPTREINGHQVQCVISGDSLTTEETLPFTIQVYCEYQLRILVRVFSRSGQSLSQPGVKVDGAKLQLLSLTSDLNGLYQCEASNAYGRKHGQLYVRVAAGEVSLDLAMQFVQIFLDLYSEQQHFIHLICSSPDIKPYTHNVQIGLKVFDHLK
uniref:Ig-like domain-containing protein n=1 Tax=Astatotilapia calliptera TaxID=8154 RepID=A0A3P8NRU6_ASTCA